MALKRSREEESVEKLAMANCVDIMKRNQSNGRSKIFECKTCKKQFDSFQALGGHRASHKNTAIKLMLMSTFPNELPVKPKKHECSFCGEEFALGQALGGHMRKHRDELNQQQQYQYKKKKIQEKSDISDQEDGKEKKDLGSEGIFFLDLNLTPYENELMAGIVPVHSWL
ncbi:PREDICTED: zinc finger protein ZAT12-like [Nicotiana attenuata]|uniref:Zinc finger protein zat8 n=1 Tax=Nicotiana attenuata TaxID=49451 RepID=A0A314KXD0_NICAT|nr:PREDICTED: zinc finger protein ZAT12-like [Nicotiana attenuata]OIT33449.1 zinc finger protein zat8 [Nicotiana attenuata]